MPLRITTVFLIVSTVASAQGSPVASRQTPVSPFGAAKARALMRDRLPCAGCHALDGDGGRLGPDLSHVAERRAASYVRRMIEDPQGTVPGTIMPKVPMAGTTRELIIAYLTRRAVRPPVAHGSTAMGAPVGVSQALPRTAVDAPTLYRRFCAPCHGAGGRGDGPNAAYLRVRPAAHADPSYMSARSDDRLFDAIQGGGYPLGRSAAMPAFGETFTSRETWALVRYLRSLCRCSGPAWSTDGERSVSNTRPR